MRELAAVVGLHVTATWSRLDDGGARGVERWLALNRSTEQRQSLRRPAAAMRLVEREMSSSYMSV